MANHTSLIYSFTPPSFPGEFIYSFTNRFGDHYRVIIGRKENDILSITISFGVVNEEYEEDEYTLTNKGDPFRVLNTVCAILQDYLRKYPYTHTIEFSGEARKDEINSPSQITARTRVYKRFVKKYFTPDEWTIEQKDNKIFIKRIHNQ